METEQKKHSNVIVYVVIGVAVLAVVFLLLGGGSGGGGTASTVAQISPQAAQAAAAGASAEQVSANQSVVAKAQTAAAQHVAILQANDALRLGLAETAAQTEQTRIAAKTDAEVSAAQNKQKSSNSALYAEVQQILAELSALSPIGYGGSYGSSYGTAPGYMYPQQGVAYGA